MKAAAAIKRIVELLQETEDEDERRALEAAIIALAGECEYQPQPQPVIVPAPYPVPYAPTPPYHPWREPMITWWSDMCQGSTGASMPPDMNIMVIG